MYVHIELGEHRYDPSIAIGAAALERSTSEIPRPPVREVLTSLLNAALIFSPPLPLTPHPPERKAEISGWPDSNVPPSVILSGLVMQCLTLVVSITSDAETMAKVGQGRGDGLAS